MFKVGDRVIVNGYEDGRDIKNEKGTIESISKFNEGKYNELVIYTIKFDKWREGWGENHDAWNVTSPQVSIIKIDEPSLEELVEDMGKNIHALIDDIEKSKKEEVIECEHEYAYGVVFEFVYNNAQDLMRMGGLLTKAYNNDWYEVKVDEDEKDARVKLPCIKQEFIELLFEEFNTNDEIRVLYIADELVFGLDSHLSELGL